jgi:hypothetical protein
MIGLRRKTVRIFASAAVLSSGLGLLALANATSSAHADPSYESAGQPYVGVGSDTLQDLFNAFSGAEPSEGADPNNSTPIATKFYTPLATSPASAAIPDNPGSLTIASFDATNPHLPYANPDTGDAITTKIGGDTFDRPNGSGDGRTALEDSTNGTLWENVDNAALLESTNGQVDFARSSSLGSTAAKTAVVNTAAGELSYIPLAADGIGYAYHCANPGTADCTTLGNLSGAVFQALYAGTGNGVLASGAGGWTGANQLDACAIQSGSGTFKTFLGDIGGGQTPAGANTALGKPGASMCTGLEENNLNSFLSNPSVVAGAADDWVVPTSVGNDIGQHNGAALNRSDQFFATNGALTTGDAIAGVADAFSTTVQAAAGAGSSTLTIGLDPTSGTVLTVDVGGSQENVTTVGTPTGADPYVVTLTAPTSFAHAVGAAVVAQGVNNPGIAVPYTGTSTWTDSLLYYSSNYGRWLFVVTPSAKISGRGEDHGLADLFYSPSATNEPGGIAAICQASAKATMSTFGFDPNLPNDGTYQNGTCGLQAYNGTN